MGSFGGDDEAEPSPDLAEEILGRTATGPTDEVSPHCLLMAARHLSKRLVIARQGPADQLGISRHVTMVALAHTV